MAFVVGVSIVSADFLSNVPKGRLGTACGQAAELKLNQGNTELKRNFRDEFCVGSAFLFRVGSVLKLSKTRKPREDRAGFLV